jgi:hypothetical protein
MNGVVVIDTNLMLLLIVGSACTNYISKHKRLGANMPSTIMRCSAL